jgi:hypothetical protein
MGGENNSPPRFFPSWARPILAQLLDLGRVRPRAEPDPVLGRDRPDPFWAGISPIPAGLGLAHLFGPAQPHNLL